MTGLHGFWSYSSLVGTLGGEKLWQAMDAALKETFGSPSTLYLDRNRYGGNPSGEDWGRHIVTELSQSALFFWLQTPRWLQSPICRFEYEVARARIARAAEALCPDVPEASARLWALSCCPVRLDTPDKDHWQTLPEAERTLFQKAWQSTQFDSAMDIKRLFDRGDAHGIEFGPICYAAVQRIRHEMQGGLASLGLTLRDFLANLDEPDPNFVRAWRIEMADRGLLEMESDERPGKTMISLRSPCSRDQKHLARKAAGGQRWRRDAGLRMVLAADQGGETGFWFTDPPLRLRDIPSGRLIDPAHQPIPNAHGVATWSAAAAMELERLLADQQLTIPNVAQTKTIHMMASQNEAVRREMGMERVVRDCWCRDGEGILLSGDSRRPLVLVAPLLG